MWINNLVDVIGNKLGLKYYLVDPGVWCKVATDKNGFEYYTYVIVYVDYNIILDKTLTRYMDILEESYTVKLSIIG